MSVNSATQAANNSVALAYVDAPEENPPSSAAPDAVTPSPAAVTQQNVSQPNSENLNIAPNAINPAANQNNLQLVALNGARFELPRPIVEKGQSGSGFNRIQVPNHNNDPRLAQLNQRLDKIYQESYVKPMQTAISDFKRTIGWGAAGSGGSAGGWAIWNKLVSGASNIPTAAALAIGNIGIGGAAGSTLKDKVEAATSDYLQKVNVELEAAGYRPVNQL
jgi:hypothetical protein